MEQFENVPVVVLPPWVISAIIALAAVGAGTVIFWLCFAIREVNR